MGTFIKPHLIDLDSFARQWFIERQTQLSNSTIKNHKYLYKNHLKPRLGHYKLQDLNPIVIQKFTNSLVTDSSLNPKSIRNNPKSIRELLFLMN